MRQGSWCSTRSRCYRLLSILSHIYVYFLFFVSKLVWPEDGRARPKHVVIVNSIKIRSYDRCILRDRPTHIYVKHNRDEIPEKCLDMKSSSRVISLSHPSFVFIMPRCPCRCWSVFHLASAQIIALFSHSWKKELHFISVSNVHLWRNLTRREGVTVYFNGTALAGAFTCGRWL